MSRPSITESPPTASARWRSRITSRTCRMARDGGHEPVDLRLADRAGHVLAVHLDRARRSRTRPGTASASSASARTVERVSAVAQREPRQRAIHRTRVQIAEAEPLRERRRRPCSSPSRPARRSPRSWRGRIWTAPGSDLLEHVEEAGEARRRPPPRPGARRPRATRPRRPRRASRAGGLRCESTTPPRSRAGTPLIRNPSSVARMCPPTRRSSSTTASIRSDSFTRSSPAPRTTVSPRAWHAATAKIGSSSIERRAPPSAVTVVPTSSEDSHLDVARPARRRSSAGCRSRRARPCARGRRAARSRRGLSPTPCTVTAEPGTIAAATRNGAADEMSPGISTSGRRERLGARSTVTLDGRRVIARAGVLEHALGVVAGRDRLDDGRRARSPGRRRGGPPTSPAPTRPEARSRSRGARAPSTTSGAWPSVVSIGRAHPAQRLGDPLHRARRERLVADELEAARPARRACPRAGA